MAGRLIFMGSDPIALPALEAVHSGACGPVELVAVYTQPDRPRGRGKKVQANEIKTWALDRGFPVLQPERVGKGERLAIAESSPDAILVMAYGHLLSQALIDTPPIGIWNLHTSILPRYRGASPIQGAIVNGDAVTGVSLMRMVRRMDAGPVLDVQKVDIEELDTALSIEAKLAAACVPLLERNLPTIFEGSVAPRDQDESQATYVRKLGKDDADLDFRVPAVAVARRINGLHPWPGARFYHQGAPIKVGLAQADSTAGDGAPGEVLEAGPRGLRLACGSGSVWLRRLQRSGGKMLEAPEFLRGYPIVTGCVIESRPMPELVSPRPFQAT